MTDFSIRIGVDDMDTDARPIGGAIAGLSAAKGAIVQAGGTIVTSSDIKSTWASWPAKQQAMVETIYNSMAINTFDDAGNESPAINRGNGDKIQEAISLVFVFEDEGQMIVPISSHRDIMRGLEEPPMNFLDTYDAGRKTAVGEKALGEFQTAIDSISALNAVQGGKVMEAFKEVFGIGTAVDPDPDANIETFYTQLGEYNMRQCR